MELKEIKSRTGMLITFKKKHKLKTTKQEKNDVKRKLNMYCIK